MIETLFINYTYILFFVIVGISIVNVALIIVIAILLKGQ